MKKPNFNHTRGASNEGSQECLPEYGKNQPLSGSPANRRADPGNPNRIMSLTFGDKFHPGSGSQIDLSKADDYKNETKKEKQGELTNHYEYGLDARGGIAAREAPVN